MLYGSHKPLDPALVKRLSDVFERLFKTDERWLQSIQEGVHSAIEVIHAALRQQGEDTLTAREVVIVSCLITFLTKSRDINMMMTQSLQQLDYKLDEDAVAAIEADAAVAKGSAE